MTLTVTQNINKFHITAVQNNKVVELQPVITINAPALVETDPIFQASEASLFVAGDKANLDNQSGINSGDETTLSIQTKRPLKTVTNKSLEGVGNIGIDYNDLDNKPPTFPPSSHTHIEADITDLDKYTKVETNNLLGNKLDKVTTSGVERAYIINADGSQGTKATSEFEDVIETQNKLITIPLGDLGVAIEDVTYEMVADYINNLGIVVEKGENYYFEVIEQTYNFDLTSPKWASKGVTDEASFINWLIAKGLSNIIVTDFNFVGDRIFCNMTANGVIYDLSRLGLVNADKIGVVNGLINLYLNDNQIVTFNPTIPLPSRLTILDLSYNQMTLASYTASEVWANTQPAFTNTCSVYVYNNIDSITGTNLEAILITKNCVIYT